MSDLKFQAIDIRCKDVFNQKNKTLECITKIYGKTMEGKTIALSVRGYKPYFFIQVDSPIDLATLKIKFKTACTGKNSMLFKSLHNMEIVKRKEFFGYKGDEQSTFIKVSFHNTYAHLKSRDIFESKLGFSQKTFEQGLKPVMRFCHDLDIQPCGWILLKKKDESYFGEEEPETDEIFLPSVNEASTVDDLQIDDMRILSSIKNTLDLAPFKVMSFDIECYSESGSFPAATRDNLLYASQLRDWYLNIGQKRVKNSDELHAIIFSSLGLIDDKNKLAKSYGLVNMKVCFSSPQHRELFLKKTKNSEYMNNLTCVLSNTELNVHELGKILDDECMFPKFEGDPITMIGNTIQKCGFDHVSEKYIIVIDDCDPIEGVTIIKAKNEADMLLKWRDLVSFIVDPDVITGYNIFGFDFSYMYERAQVLGIEDKFMKMGRMTETSENFKMCHFKNVNFSSSAVRNNQMNYIEMPGRVIIDMYNYIYNTMKLQNCSLNAVSEDLLKMNKNDLSPKEMFRIYKEGGSDNIKTIAEYCIQDCVLVNHLMTKLQNLVNYISMANVCSIPMEFLITGGQGVKVYSLMTRTCSLKGYLIRDRMTYTQSKIAEAEEKEAEARATEYDSDDDETSSKNKKDNKNKKFQGALVLDCKENLYVDPVAVLDFNSLYPSCIIANGMSPERTVLDDKYLKPDDDVLSVEYAPGKIAKFVQIKGKAIVPEVLEHLIDKRKEVKKMMASCEDPLQKKILDGLQQAYKVTANSIYGTLGTSFSPIYFEQVAASTTAIGRNMLMKACDFLKDHAEIIYGDTDSVFIRFKLEEKGKAAIMPTINMAKKLGNEFSQTLKKPLKLEYEKVFYPLLLMSKKRYIGNLYEDDDIHSKPKSMGDVSVRKDAIPFVKKLYKSLMEIILNNPENCMNNSIAYVQQEVRNLLNGNVPLNDLIMSNALGSTYKNPNMMKSYMVAQRMAERDPGNKPQPGQRVSFVFIVNNKPNACQVERVEDPAYVEAMNLPIDYKLYFTSQVEKPILTIYGTMAPLLFPYMNFEQRVQDKINQGLTETKARESVRTEKQKYVKSIVFNGI
jgi:DNA polymerase delta subunit 1